MRGLCLLLWMSCCLHAMEFHPYCWGFLNAHPDRAEMPQAEVMEIQKGHLAHMERMSSMGRLMAAGPLATPGGARGLLVYQCESVKQAEEWTALDPAVVNKRLVVEIYRWKATGLWGEPLTTQRKTNPDAKYQMVQLPFAVVERLDARPAGDPIPQALVAEHTAYASELSAQGKLRSFGLFEGAPDKLGIFVYAAMDLEEARKLAEADPLVKSGWGKAVMHVWFVADETVPAAGGGDGR
ncbi:MAG: hypothetical protein KIT83_00510 [Bryobacterales bacterium]|nr:hypothetical protein [Bryobacterales bacterium]